MMNEHVDYDANSLSPALVEAIAREVAGIINQRLSPKAVLKLFQVVFLDVEEAALLLRVKPKTISTWISQDRIPVRYAGGRPIFLLSELLQWTLPDGDKHAAHRLSAVASSNIAMNRLATNREGRVPDVG